MTCRIWCKQLEQNILDLLTKYTEYNWRWATYQGVCLNLYLYITAPSVVDSSFSKGRCKLYKNKWLMWLSLIDLQELWEALEQNILDPLTKYAEYNWRWPKYQGACFKSYLYYTAYFWLWASINMEKIYDQLDFKKVEINQRMTKSKWFSFKDLLGNLLIFFFIKTI